MKHRKLILTALAAVCLSPLFIAGTVVKGITDGYHIGTATTQKVGFWGATPIVQPTAAGQAALTDSTTGSTADSTLAAGAGITTITIPVDLPSVAGSALFSAYTPGYKFKLLKVTFADTKPVTTGSKLATITPSISGVNVTGGVLALTSATATPVGTLINGSTVTAANTGSATDTITLTGSSVTTFTEGQGVILLEVQNMDTADAFAKSAVLDNALRTGLVNAGLIHGS